MSQGCAVIASNKGGMPWVVSDAGLIFNDGDVADLGDKLERVIRNESLRKTMQKKSTSRAKLFRWKDTASVLDRNYKAVLSRER
jgi:glycosyltransferase involved in cell wall biosynthesis